MLSELCHELNNWFDKERIIGDVTIEDGKVTDSLFLSKIQPNQYFRIVGSVFNDGVYQYTDELTLTDETFRGGLWLMAIPKDVLDLADDIKAWCDKYESVDSVAMSPFQSESFGGYSYSKASGGSADGSTSPTWQSTFAKKLKLWRML